MYLFLRVSVLCFLCVIPVLCLWALMPELKLMMMMMIYQRIIVFLFSLNFVSKSANKCAK